MGSQQFCLRWNNHQTNMLNVFDQLLQSEDFVDVTLACEGMSVKAHKMVLSACSPYFQSLFKENPCKHPIVILKDMKYTELRSIVDFMYKGEINVSQDQLSNLLKTAETLKIKGLAEVSSGAVPQSLRQHTNHGSLDNRGRAEDAEEAIELPQTSNGTEVMEPTQNGRMSPRRKRRRTSPRPSLDESVECLDHSSAENVGEPNSNIMAKIEPVDFDFDPPVALLMEPNPNYDANNGTVMGKKSRKKSSSSPSAKLKSPLWKHYVKGTIVRSTAICSYCGAVINRKDGTTACMRQHLLREHTEEYEDYLKDAKKKRSLKRKHRKRVTKRGSDGKKTRRSERNKRSSLTEAT